MRDGKPRAYGPYKHGNQWRVAWAEYVDVNGVRTRTTTYEIVDSEAEGIELVAGARDEAQGFTVRMAVDAFIEAKKTKGLASTTIDNYNFRLARLLGLDRNANRPIRFVAGRGGELYAGSIRGAADTHINGLNVGRMFGAWCVKQRMLKTNPFADVEAQGRKTPGAAKPRLTVNESRKLEAYCFQHSSNPDCVLTYGYLMLGKRASELVGVRVRDLDDDGWLLRITKAKTEASVKSIGVPERLRAMLLELAKGRAQDAHLFVNMSGEPMSRYVARDRVRAVLKAAKVPVLPPQALRRTFVDNAERQGFALHAIADMAGHESTAITRRSYMSPERVESGAVERNLKVLAGGKR